MNNTKNLIANQQTFFKSNKTRDLSTRIKYLKTLKNNIIANCDDICKALMLDLGKSEYESYMTEIGMALSEINHQLKHIKHYAKRKKVATPISLFPAKSYIYPVPYGTVLIMSPWNYPFNLSIIPLVDAIAAGNTAIIKPSNYSPNASNVIKKIIDQTFPAEYVAVVTGGREANQDLLEQKFDYIFFTGGATVGRLVLEKASKYLTPVSLELGGKSPCIVCKDADIPTAAARIAFGKYLNAGQTCVAPDYLLIDYHIKDQFIDALKGEITKQFGINPIDNYSYGKIINEKHFDRLVGLLKDEKVLFGGSIGKGKISPTIVDKVTLASPIMKEEIFGPILPVITFNKLEEIVDTISHNPNPLALYLFTNDKKVQDYIVSNVNFGGGCINDTISHLANDNFGFGGVGESGMGSYHGKNGFDTFSHHKSIVVKRNWLDVKLRYQPFNDSKMKILKKFLK